MAKEQSIWAEKLTFKDQVKVIRGLLPFAKPYKWYFFSAIVAIGVVSAINVLLPRILQEFMNKYLGHLDTKFQVLIIFAAVYFGVSLLKAVFQFLQEYLYGLGGAYAEVNTREQLYRHIHTLGMRYFDQNPAGSILSRVTNDTQALFEVWRLFMLVLMGTFGLVASYYAMFVTNAKIALALLIFLPFLFGAVFYYQRVSSKVYGGMREKLSQLNAKIAESINGINVIQQFRQEMRMGKDFAVTNDEYQMARIRMIKTESLLLNPLMNLFNGLGIVIILGMFGWHSMDAAVAAGTVYAFISYLNNFFAPMSEIMQELALFQDGSVAGVRVLRILENQELAPAQVAHPHGEITQGKIEFKNVTFSYDGVHPILKNLSFTALPGQTIALVGHTGSGKSSTINALMRFYDFQEGQILIDDQDIREYPIAEIRKKLGLVLQESFMFYGDVSSNIRMFNQDITDEQVKAAAEFVQASRFIEELPKKYAEPVIEHGATFSAGEKQLLNFARTIVTNPKILVLDEATANIDTETEVTIQKALAKMRNNRTTIAIAHRLSTIEDANLILVLDQGEVIERGTHAELLALNGKYKEMYDLQGKEV
ncbi:ABC transporter ATP-binding protein [Periweissella fabalis]|uniref:ABC transporter ATP-binding protein n=1 Tax=Periweissella fabalis TaxID=1070421 RepID=A0A7X6N1Y7_9LACO|nr:ABC transporter ATP-binding protein [Periweissella fabalis]MCM0599316.1 ABC transporter ATP-binding protein [Periweissella fabalis]NKZ23595.1 ABC transporter ATP-binding protein [Periweissella fabalis]